MQLCEHETQLKEMISRLENALLTPVIAGELVGWVTTVQEAADNLASCFRTYAEKVLHPQYKEIAKADNELLFRVEQLRKEELALLTQHEEFRRDLQLLAKRAPRVGEDEAKVADERAEVEREGMKLMTEMKRQQLAATAWLSEALYRDRGPGD